MTPVRLTRRGRIVGYGVPFVLVLMAVERLLTATPPPAAAPPLRPAVTSGSRSPAPTPSGTPSAAAVPRPSPRPARPDRVPVVTGGTGRLAVVPGRSAVHGQGPVRRFVVEVEEGIGVAGPGFAAAVERVLFDRRSWIGAGGLALQRVDSGPVAFRVVLASPALTRRLCRPLDTGRTLSCFQRGRSVLNVYRWRNGAAAYGGDLASYRIYLVNHEVGHALGHGHRGCPGAGRPAPVMMQQTKGIGACRPNPWPLPGER